MMESTDDSCFLQHKQDINSESVLKMRKQNFESTYRGRGWWLKELSELRQKELFDGHISKTNDILSATTSKTDSISMTSKRRTRSSRSSYKSENSKRKIVTRSMARKQIKETTIEKNKTLSLKHILDTDSSSSEISKYKTSQKSDQMQDIDSSSSEVPEFKTLSVSSTTSKKKKLNTSKLEKPSVEALRNQCSEFETKNDLVLNNTKTSDRSIDKANDVILNKTKKLLFDKTYQPKVVLQDIAYSDKLSQKQKDMLLAHSFSHNKSLGSKNSNNLPKVKKVKTKNKANSWARKSRSKKTERTKQLNLSISNTDVLCLTSLTSHTRSECSVETKAESLFNNTDSETPLDLSIRKSVEYKINFSQDLIGTTKYSSQNTNASNIEFGNKPLDEINFNVSFSEFKDFHNLLPSQESSELRGKGNKIPQKCKFERRESTSLYSDPQSAEIFPQPASNLECETKQSSTILEKSSLMDNLTSAQLDVNKSFTEVRKPTKIDKKKNSPSKRIHKESQTVSNKTNHQVKQDTTNLISNEEPLITNLLDLHTVNKDTNNEPPTMTIPLDMYSSEDNVYSLELPKNFNTDTLPVASMKKQSISNNRSLPMIISEETLPKGTIKISSVMCEPAKSSKYTFKTNTENMPCFNDVNQNIRKQEDLNFEFPFYKYETQQATNKSKPDEINSKAKINQSPHQSFENLCDICPELVKYYNADLINNNNNNNESIDKNTNDNKNDLVNIDLLETTGSDNVILSSLTLETTKIDHNNMNMLSNNAENTGNLRYVFVDETTVNSDHTHNKTNVKSSKGLVTNKNLDTEKSPVIAELTIANLKNFTQSSCHDNDHKLNWYLNTRQYYLSSSDTEKQSELVKSTPKDQKGSFEINSKQLKRKWIQDEKDHSFKSTEEKRLKLNRNRCTIFKSKFNSANNISVADSIQSDVPNNSGLLDVVNNIQPKEVKVEDVKCIQHEINEDDKSTQHEISESQNLEPNIINCNNVNIATNFNIPTTISANIFVNEDIKTCEYDYGDKNFLKGGVSNTSLINVQRNDCNSLAIDKNGNLTSSSSPSSMLCSSSATSSTSSKSKSISNPEKPTCSKTSNAKTNKNKLDKNDAMSNDLSQSYTKEQLDYEYDDCISLFADPHDLFENSNDSCNLINEDLPPSVATTEPVEKFCDITDGAYFNKSKEEYNNVPDGFKTGNYTSNFNKLLFNGITTNANDISDAREQQNFNRSAQRSTSTQISQNLNSGNISNVKDRFSAKKEPTNNLCTTVRALFNGHCFTKLRHGFCRKLGCRFVHRLASGLSSNIHQKDRCLIIEIFDYAILHNFEYFTRKTYANVIMKTDYDNIILLFHKLHIAGLINEQLVQGTIGALIKVGKSLRDIVSEITKLLDTYNVTIAEYIVKVSAHMIEPGTYWETYRDLFVKVNPLTLCKNTIIQECIDFSKDKLHIMDVYRNYIQRLTQNQLSDIDNDLKEEFYYLLRKNNLIHETMYPANSLLFTDINLERTFSNDMAINFFNDRHEILSPVNRDLISTHQSIQVSQRPRLQGNLGMSSLMINNMASNHNFFNQRRDAATQSLSNQSSPGLNIRTWETENDNPSTGALKLYPIDGLKSPQSKFRQRHREFYSDLMFLKEVLKRQDYGEALAMLNKYHRDPIEETPLITSYYRILCRTVMKSAHHVRNLIKLSVQMGVSKFLSQTLFTFGMYTIIELCNVSAWILAYNILKSLKSTDLLEKIAAFVLIYAEVCLANGRPLKAFTMLKRNNMLCTSCSKWRPISNPSDEYVQRMIVNQLLDVLCQKFPDRAFYIFTYLVQNQVHIYYPIDLTAYIDKLVMGVLNGKYNDLIIRVGQFIIEQNFALNNSVFQALVINLFQKDVELCRKLYCYGIWLGIYPIVKLTAPMNILIRTNWTKEEMYLVIIEFLEKLSMDVGHTIDHIAPTCFSIHLKFELAPFKEQLSKNGVHTCNKDELKQSKQLMKTVLQEQFNPPIKTIIAERETFLKLQSRSVVNYLKILNAQKL